LTDIIMPGMDGHELSDRLASHRRALRVLYMSGYAVDVVVNRGGVLNHSTTLLQKPFNRAALLRKVREVLDN